MSRGESRLYGAATSILKRRKEVCCAVASGLLFVLSLYIALGHIDPNWYTARDDGVITLSSARNLVDYGFVGMNPSGPIVESSSAPMQFAIYAVSYLVSKVSYETYSTVQTYISYFFIGVLVFLFFRARPLTGLMLSGTVAVVLSQFPSFYEWQASGMENAITNLLFLSSVFVLYEQFRKGKIDYRYSVLLFAASISRIEDIYHIAPLLLVFSGFWRWVHKTFQGAKFAGVVLALWLGFMLWRYMYFGQLLPNTAYAQNISVIDRIKWLLTGNAAHLLESYHLSQEIFFKLGIWILLPAGILFVLSRKSPKELLLSALCLSLIATSLFNPFLFGPTRIDEVRTTSFDPLFIALMITCWLFWSIQPKKGFLVSIFLLPIVIGVYPYAVAKPYYLGWSTASFNRTREEFMTIARAMDIGRPTTANPDLGVMTWYKDLNDVGNPPEFQRSTEVEFSRRLYVGGST